MTQSVCNCQSCVPGSVGRRADKDLLVLFWHRTYHHIDTLIKKNNSHSNQILMITFSGNHYGTPKPSPDSPAKTDTVIPGAHPSSEVSLIMSLLRVILISLMVNLFDDLLKKNFKLCIFDTLSFVPGQKASKPFER